MIPLMPTLTSTYHEKDETNDTSSVCVCVCVCVCARARARACVCVRVSPGGRCRAASCL